MTEKQLYSNQFKATHPSIAFVGIGLAPVRSTNQSQAYLTDNRKGCPYILRTTNPRLERSYMLNMMNL